LNGSFYGICQAPLWRQGVASEECFVVTFSEAAAAKETTPPKTTFWPGSLHSSHIQLHRSKLGCRLFPNQYEMAVINTHTGD
jgi:hypothetical protein